MLPEPVEEPCYAHSPSHRSAHRGEPFCDCTVTIGGLPGV
jgi:hypothetical protein